MIEAKLIRNNRSGQIYINITYPDGYDYNLWESLVEHCSRDLNNNELMKVWDDVNKQLLNTDPNDIPLTFKEVLKELQQTIINRGIWKNELGEKKQ